jgi:hypothetical protein
MPQGLPAMTDEFETDLTPEKRSIAKPLLTMAIVLTVAWFAIVGVTIASQHNPDQISAYGIDDAPSLTVLASR